MWRTELSDKEQQDMFDDQERIFQARLQEKREMHERFRIRREEIAAAKRPSLFQRVKDAVGVLLK